MAGPTPYRCDGCGATGTKEELEDERCPFYSDCSGDHDTHLPHPDTRICPLCGEQGLPNELAVHDCTAAEPKTGDA